MDIPCTDYDFKFLKAGGKLTRYELIGMPAESCLITMDVDKVIAVQRIK